MESHQGQNEDGQCSLISDKDRADHGSGGG